MDNKYLVLTYSKKLKRGLPDQTLELDDSPQISTIPSQQQTYQIWKDMLDRVYQYPADKEYAEIHKKANTFGEELDCLENPIVCICCEMPINTVPIDVSQSTMPEPPGQEKDYKKFKLNSSASIFFTIIKIFIAYLLMRIIISDSYNLYTSWHGSYCSSLLPKIMKSTNAQESSLKQTHNLFRYHLQNSQTNSTLQAYSRSPNDLSNKTHQSQGSCVQDFRAYLSYYNKHSQHDSQTFIFLDFLNIIVTVLSMIFFLYCRQQLFKINNLINFDTITQDQYSLLIENIPLFVQKLRSGPEYNYKQAISKAIADQYQLWLQPLKPLRDFISKLINAIQQNVKICCPIGVSDQTMQKIRMQFLTEFINFQYSQHSTDLFIIQQTATIKNKILEILDDQKYKNGIQAYRSCWNEMKLFINNQQNKFKQKCSQIKSVTIFFDSQQIERLSSTRQNLMNKHVKNVDLNAKYGIHVKYKKFSQTKILRIQALSLIKSNKSIAFKSKRLEMKSQFIVLKFLGKAFVTFQHEYFKDYLLDKYQKDSKFLKIQGNSLEIRQAPQPTEVYWKNLRFTSQERQQQKTISRVSIYSNLFAFFMIQLVLNYFATKQNKLHIKEHPESIGFMISTFWNKIKGYIFQIFIPASITVANYFVKKLIEKSTDEQRHISKEDKLYFYLLRTIIFQFVNSAILYFILGIINSEYQPLSKDGFVIQTLDLIGMSFILQFIINNFQQYVASYFTFLDPIKSIVPGGEQQKGNTQSFVYYQKQLNQSVELQQFNCAEKYISYIGQAFLVAFYAMLIPLGPVLLIIIFIIQYRLDKKTLFGNSSFRPLNFRITKKVWYIFEHILLITAVGNLIADCLNFQVAKNHGRKNKLILLNVINISISAIYIGLVYHCNDFLFTRDKTINNRKYSQSNGKISKTYESQDHMAKYKHFFKRFNEPIVISQEQLKKKIDTQKLKDQQNQKYKTQEQYGKYKKYYQQHHKIYDLV